MSRHHRGALFSLLPFCFVILTMSAALGIDYSSTSFILRDPVVSVGGGYSSSSSFQYTSVFGQTVIGESASASTTGRFGFLYFPSFITAPLVTATAGVEEVALSWTAASGTVAVDHYELGTATVSAGETYQNVGSVLSYTKTGLIGATTYYFTVRAVDGTGEATIVSSEVTATPTAASSPTPTPAPSGGGIITSSVGDAALPASPYARFGEALDTSTIRWYFTDRATNETGFQIRDSNADVRATTPPWVTQDSTFLDEVDLSANSIAVGRRAHATNMAGVSAPSEMYAPVYTSIENPTALESVVSDGVVYLRASSSALSGGFSNLANGRSGLLFEDVTRGVSSGWVKAETYALSGLPAGTYQFRVRARNGDAIETATSPTITVIVPPSSAPSEGAEKPTVEIVSPSNGSTVTSDTVTITGRTVPGARVMLRYGDVETFTIAGTNGVFRFTLTNVKNGTQQLTFVARTPQGVVSDTALLTFIVALPGAEPGSPTVITPEPPAEVPPGVVIPPRIPVELPGLPTLPRIEGLPIDVADGTRATIGALKAVRDFVRQEVPTAVGQLGIDVRFLASRLPRPTIAPVVQLARSIGAAIRARSTLIADEMRLAARVVTRDVPRAFGDGFRTFARSTARLSLFKSTQPPVFVRSLLFTRAQFSRTTTALHTLQVAFLDGFPALGKEVRQRLARAVLATQPVATGAQQFVLQVVIGTRAQLSRTRTGLSTLQVVFLDGFPALGKEVRQRLARAVQFAPQQPSGTQPIIISVFRTIRADISTIAAIGRIVGTGLGQQVPVAIQVAQTAVRSLSPAPYVRQVLEQQTQDLLAVTSAAMRAGTNARERAVLLVRALSPVPVLQRGVGQLRTDAGILAEAISASTRSVAYDTTVSLREYRTAVQLLADAITIPSVRIDTAEWQATVISYYAIATQAVTRTRTFFVSDVPQVVRIFASDIRLAIRPPSRESIDGAVSDSPTPLVATVRPRPTETPSVLPVDSVIAKSSFGNITLSAASDEALRLPAGYSFKLFVRPSKPVSEITGELILTAAQGSTDMEDVPSNLFLRIPAAQAAIISPVDALALSVATFPYRRTDTGIYAAYASVPPLIGSYQLLTHLAYTDGTKRTIERDIETESTGYVYATTERGQQERIRGAVVSLRVEREDQTGFVIWPGALFDQSNPVKTNETGAYQFLPPPGRYRLVVEHPDYETYQSDLIDLMFTMPIARPIELTPRGGIFTRMLQTVFPR